MASTIADVNFHSKIKGLNLATISTSDVENLARTIDAWTREAKGHAIAESMICKAAECEKYVYDIGIDMDGCLKSRVVGSDKQAYFVSIRDIINPSDIDTTHLESLCTCPHRSNGGTPFCKHGIATLVVWTHVRLTLTNSPLITGLTQLRLAEKNRGMMEEEAEETYLKAVIASAMYGMESR